MGFGQGLSGLNAASQNLDVIGNNIANSGTVGFKAGTATFADVYASSRVGLGVSVASINQRFTVGTVSSTGNQFDMAIDGPKGLFRVIDQSGSVLYTRNGQFFADKDNNIVNAQGQRLTGFENGGTTPVPIKVPVGNIAPQATTGLTTKANFDANADVISEAGRAVQTGVVNLVGTVPVVPGQDYYYRTDDAGEITWYTDINATTVATAPQGTFTSGANTVVIDANGQIESGEFETTGGNNQPYLAELPAVPFDPADADSYTHSLSMSVYDSLGNSHELTQYYVKRAGSVGTESNWQVYYRLDGKAVSASADGGASSTNPVDMTFDARGQLVSGRSVALTVASPGGLDTPADALNMDLNYAGSTQYGGEFSSNFTQTGYATGEYASMSIAADGSIVASYTNGETQAMGTLVLANFNNLQGLQPVGGNAWAETSASGQPILGTPGNNGMATIKGQSVEDSNVDMSVELVNMIIAQRTYQANAQTIKTQDQVLQTLINLR